MGFVSAAVYIYILLWVMTPCDFVGGYQCFGGTCRSYFLRNIQTVYETIWHHNSEEHKHINMHINNTHLTAIIITIKSTRENYKEQSVTSHHVPVMAEYFSAQLRRHSSAELTRLCVFVGRNTDYTQTQIRGKFGGTCVAATHGRCLAVFREQNPREMEGRGGSEGEEYEVH
jgi:hypothetical protein